MNHIYNLYIASQIFSVSNVLLLNKKSINEQHLFKSISILMCNIIQSLIIVKLVMDNGYYIEK